MDERASEEGAAAAKLLDDGDRGDEVPPLSSVFLLDRQTADAEICKLSKQLGGKAMFAVEPSTQFGRQLGSFQGVSMRAADAYIDIQAMRSTMWEAAWRIDNGHSGEKEAAIAKWWACRGGHRVTHTTQHLHGGIGADVTA